MKRFVFSLFSAGLILATAVPLVADPPIVSYEVTPSPVNPQVKQRTYKFTFYDRIESTNGQVRLAHPGWTEKMHFRRGRSIEGLDKVFYVPYTRAKFEGEIGLRASTIKQLQYWEQMALLEVERSRQKKDWETAEKLLSQIQQFNPKWAPERIAELKKLVELDRAKELIAPRSSDRDRDQGLQVLAQLVKAQADLPGLEEAYVEAYIDLAKKAKKAENFEQVHQLLAVTSASYPESEPVQQFQNELAEEAGDLVKQADIAEQNGQPKQALQLALAALTRSPTQKIRDDVLPFLKKYQILKVACYEDAGAFEPFNAIQPLEKQLLPLLYEHIVQPDESGRNFLLGPLVSQLDEKDFGRLCIIDLEPQQRFSDGSPISSQDVANTIRLLRDPAGEAYDPEWDRYVEGATVDGPYRLKVKLRQHSLPRSLLTIPITQYTVQLPKRGSDASKKPVVSGAFEVAPRLPDGSLALAANEYFREADQGRPFLKEIHFKRFIKKGTGAAVDDLEQGRVHLISDPSPIQLLRLQNAKGFVSRRFLSDSVYILALNHRKAPFKNRDFRRAMLYALNRQRILDQYYGGGKAAIAHTVVSGPFPPQSPAYDQNLKPRPQDINLARSLLSRLPSDVKRPITIKFPAGDITTELAVEQIRKNLEAVGFDVQTETKLPNDLVDEVIRKHDYDVAYWRLDHDNIMFNIAPLFDAKPEAKQPGGSNFMGYDHPQLSQLFADLRNERVGDKVWKAQHLIHQFLHTEVAFIPLWRLDSSVVYTSRLVGRRNDGSTHDLPISTSHLFRRPEDWYLEP